jgi:beta-lactamase class A
MMIGAQIFLTAALMCSLSELPSHWTRVASPAGGRVGVAVMIVETGDYARMNDNEHFPMQSVYKVPIVMTVLKRVDEGKLRLDQKVTIKADELPPEKVHSPIRDKNPRGITLLLRELLRASIVESDGGASDALLALVPPKDVNEFLRHLGIQDMVVLNTEKELASDWQVQYRNWTTPAAAVKLLSAIQQGKALSARNNNLLLSWMRTTQTGARRIRAMLPKGTVVADKTGTSGTEGGVNAATNDIGLVTLPNGNHMAIAVFVSDSKADQSVRESVIAKIAGSAWSCWTGK